MDWNAPAGGGVARLVIENWGLVIPALFANNAGYAPELRGGPPAAAAAAPRPSTSQWSPSCTRAMKVSMSCGSYQPLAVSSRMMAQVCSLV